MLVISGVIESRFFAPVRLYTPSYAGADNWTADNHKQTDENGIQIMVNSNYTCTYSATTVHTTLCRNKSTNETGGISSFRIDPLYTIDASCYTTESFLNSIRIPWYSPVTCKTGYSTAGIMVSETLKPCD
ncbi:hypothetical protein FNYG_14822 [Fusarium nygamai]|uniref:Uncharacterized protein n=1 Tax=Gibberella nygamai TaxID=42673 RepID=A0A2K0UPY5_GIBNY|nr:hypothetical protein FNYG_14822 [Fusarium nygamai]